MTEPGRVGVRELRQNLSVYLRRVVRGETLVVTDRGQPVARLTPLSTERDPLARLIAEGRVRPALGNWRELGPPLPPLPGAPPLVEILDELREDRV